MGTCIHIERENWEAEIEFTFVCVHSIPLTVAHKSHPKKLRRKRWTTPTFIFSFTLCHGVILTTPWKYHWNSTFHETHDIENIRTLYIIPSGSITLHYSVGTFTFRFMHRVLLQIIFFHHLNYSINIDF